MQSLRDLQIKFSAAIFSSNAATGDLGIREYGLTHQQRVRVYQNNIYTNLTESLQVIFPMILLITGKDCFINLAHTYIDQHPPVTGDLHDFGSQFSIFLSHFTPLQQLPYLSEVAALEWAIHLAFHGEDAQPVNLVDVQNIQPKEYGKLKFKLHPTSQLFKFQFPIWDIWQMCQQEDNANILIDLSTGGDMVLIVRPQLNIHIEKLTKGEFALLNSFSNGDSLEKACATALGVDPHCPLDFYLRQHIARGNIIRILL